MSDLEFRRRVMMQFGISGDKWDDVSFILPCRGTSKLLNLKLAMTPIVAVTPGHSITLSYGMPQYRTTSDGQGPVILLYDGSKAVASYYNITHNPRTVAPWPNYAYVSMPFSVDGVADAYILDNTTGEYLWRGSDYVD